MRGRKQGEREREILKFKILNVQINDFYHADIYFAKKKIKSHRNEHIAGLNSAVASSIRYGGKPGFVARPSIVIESRV